MTDKPDENDENDESDEQDDIGDEAGEPGEIDPVLVAILQTLWDHTRGEPDKDLSLARISKRASVQMSVLRRVLTQLGEADLVTVAMTEDGRGTARLTPEGETLCGQLFEEDGGDGANQTVH